MLVVCPADVQVMRECMEQLAERHPSVKQCRVVGLFGVIDLQKNTRGDFIAAVTDPLPPALVQFKYVAMSTNSSSHNAGRICWLMVSTL